MKKIYKIVQGRTTPLQYESVEVKAEGSMFGYGMFVARDGNMYRVYDKKTGYTLSNNVHKTIKNAIESEMLYLLGRADNSKDTLIKMFERAYQIASERGTSITLN